jgi:hypothetical protein
MMCCAPLTRSSPVSLHRADLAAGDASRRQQDRRHGGVAILLDVGTAVYGEVIPDQPSRTATRSRSCKASIGAPHGTHQREHGRLWRGHSRPAQPHGNSISIVHRVHRRPSVSVRFQPANSPRAF